MMKKLIHTGAIWSGLIFSLCFFFSVSLFPGRQSGFSEPPGPLSKVHGELGGAANCVRCHETRGKIAPTKCLNCHQDLASRVSAGRGYHKDKGEDCAVCHQEHQGVDVPLVQWQPADFDHAETGYLLTGAHQKVKSCERCHNPAHGPKRIYSKTFFITDNRCFTCHQDAHRGSQPECTDCHTSLDWRVDIW